MRGYFLAIEGPDGSGKSSISDFLKESLEKENYNCIQTREPGGTKIGEEIRKILLSPENRNMSDRAEALLYAASRAQHVYEKIMPNIEKGAIVICDRYIMSSLAYQGFSRNLGIEEVLRINEFATNMFYPDRTLFIDVDPITALKRKFKDGEVDRLELEGERFHKRVYEGYKESIKQIPNKITIIDGSKNFEEVSKACLEVIREDIYEINNSDSSR